MKSIAWTIGGSDSGGGAGVQADIKTFNALGVHGCSVITAITAQNTIAVSNIESVSSAMIESQIQALLEDLPPTAIKTGMLYSSAIIEQIGNFFASSQVFKICDPVMIATSGGSLLSNKNTNENSVEKIIRHILPTVDLLTPNLPEAEALLGIKNSTSGTQVKAHINETYIKDLADKLLALGPKAVLIKGGHNTGPFSNDYFQSKDISAWLVNRRIDTQSTHGTGCTLSAAITAAIALGYALQDAIVIAKAYVSQGLRTAQLIGTSNGPINHGSWPENYCDLPMLMPTSINISQISETPDSPSIHDTPNIRNLTNVPDILDINEWIDLPAFPNCGEQKLGVYPIVDNSDWLEKLLPLGVSTIQLRIKDNNNGSQKQIEKEIIKAIEIAKRFSCRLFINDYWQLAIKYGAYGVHLGQEDLDTADIKALIKSGIRLGISTHSYSEVAHALAYKPSYIAIGPIYPTTTKLMAWQPQGLEGLRRWRRSLPYPLVAIAGITLERLPSVVEAGADGIAVIRAILNDKDPLAATKAWLEVYNKQLPK